MFRGEFGVRLVVCVEKDTGMRQFCNPAEVRKKRGCGGLSTPRKPENYLSIGVSLVDNNPTIL